MTDINEKIAKILKKMELPVSEFLEGMLLQVADLVESTGYSDINLTLHRHPEDNPEDPLNVFISFDGIDIVIQEGEFVTTPIKDSGIGLSNILIPKIKDLLAEHKDDPEVTPELIIKKISEYFMSTSFQLEDEFDVEVDWKDTKEL